MNRVRFYKEVEVDSVQEVDFLFRNLSIFFPRYKSSQYRINEADLQRPDLISYRTYGTVKYWWLILSYNKIENPFTGLDVGDIIKLPNIIDIYDFYKKYAIR